jgi:hypothetical protein
MQRVEFLPDRGQVLAANSLRANPGSHATVARMAAISSALNTRPLWTHGPRSIVPIAHSPAETQTECAPLILPETRTAV